MRRELEARLHTRDEELAAERDKLTLLVSDFKHNLRARHPPHRSPPIQAQSAAATAPRGPTRRRTRRALVFAVCGALPPFPALVPNESRPPDRCCCTRWPRARPQLLEERDLELARLILSKEKGNEE